MSRFSRTDPSISGEPQFNKEPHAPDPSEQRALQNLSSRPQSESDLAEQSVFDEPVFSGEVPEEGRTYWSWIENRASQVGHFQSWTITFAAALAAGPWAALGAFAQGMVVDFYAVPYLVSICVIIPTLEEMLKVAVPSYLVESRPFYFKASSQVVFCAFMGGLIFGVLENLLYLNVYISEPSDFLVRWRWIGCTLLHVTCSTTAGAGLARVWKETRRRKQKPDLTAAFPFLLTAMILHGSFNLVASLLSLSGFSF